MFLIPLVSRKSRALEDAAHPTSNRLSGSGAGPRPQANKFRAHRYINVVLYCSVLQCTRHKICMVSTFSRGWINQPGMAANPARDQLNRKNFFSPVPVRAREFGLARRVRPSRPASASSFSTLRLNMVLTCGIPPVFRGGVHRYREPPSGQSLRPYYIRVYRVTQLRTDDVHCRDSAGSGPVVLEVVPVTNVAFSDATMDQFSCASLFPRPRPLLVCVLCSVYCTCY